MRKQADSGDAGCPRFQAVRRVGFRDATESKHWNRRSSRADGPEEVETGSLGNQCVSVLAGWGIGNDLFEHGTEENERWREGAGPEDLRKRMAGDADYRLREVCCGIEGDDLVRSEFSLG